MVMIAVDYFVVPFIDPSKSLFNTFFGILFFYKPVEYVFFKD